MGQGSGIRGLGFAGRLSLGCFHKRKVLVLTHTGEKLLVSAKTLVTFPCVYFRGLVIDSYKCGF